MRLPDAARVASLFRRAEIAHLSRLPTSDLAAEIIELTTDLTTGGRASLLRRLQSRPLSLAQTSPSIMLNSAKPTSGCSCQVARQPAPSDTRLAHADAKADLSGLACHRDHLAQRLALIDEDPAAHDTVAERLERLRAALDNQINRAIEQARTNPPPYIVDLIGDDPGDAGRSWDKRVRQLEAFRHHHGLNPSDVATTPGAVPPNERSVHAHQRPPPHSHGS